MQTHTISHSLPIPHMSDRSIGYSLNVPQEQVVEWVSQGMPAMPMERRYARRSKYWLNLALCVKWLDQRGYAAMVPPAVRKDHPLNS